MTGTASSSAAATSSRATSRRGRRRSTGRASRRRGRTTSFPLPEVLDRRALNRATLARQLLLERSALRPLDLLERLVGLQAQTPQSPYVSAWSRLDGFDAEELSALIRDRRAVRVALMRSTIHLVSARDCLRLRPLVQPSIDRQFAGSRHSKLAAGAEVQEVAAAGRALLREEAVSFTELGRRLALQFPGSDAGALAMVMRTQVPLVQIPPRGLWRQPGAPLVAAAEDWLGKPLARRSSLPQLVRRYLAAFGPASVRDFQTWSGLNRMRETIERLRPELATFRDDRGAELYDLPDAPRPQSDTPAPVRFLPDFDNVLIGHQDRRRMVADDDRALPIGTPTVLVDGFVRATWRYDRARGRLDVESLGRLSKPERRELADESERLVAFFTDRPA